MTGDQTASLVWGVVCLLLVASSLAARRLPMAQTLKMALAWIAIFFGAFALFSFRHELQFIWKRVQAEMTGSSVDAGGTLRIRASDGGHYFADAEVNGSNMRFMIDSGATTTAMSTAAARTARVQIDETGFPVIIQTANGASEGRRGRVERLKIGPIERRDFPVLVSDNLGDTNLIGMNFLTTLDGWRVEGNELVLNP